VCYPASRVWDTWWTEWQGTGFSPGTLVICCQYISTIASHALFSAVSMSRPVLHTHFSFLLSVCLHNCFTRTFFLMSVCLDQFSTCTSVFCCQYVSTIASRALFPAVSMSRPVLHTHFFPAVSMSRPVPKGSNSLSLTLYIQLTLAVDNIVK
jgi:hypothetical protein